jgi:hypothetical protein
MSAAAQLFVGISPHSKPRASVRPTREATGIGSWQIPGAGTEPATAAMAAYGLFAAGQE